MQVSLSVANRQKKNLDRNSSKHFFDLAIRSRSFARRSRGICYLKYVTVFVNIWFEMFILRSVLKQFQTALICSGPSSVVVAFGSNLVKWPWPELVVSNKVDGSGTHCGSTIIKGEESQWVSWSSALFSNTRFASPINASASFWCIFGKLLSKMVFRLDNIQALGNSGFKFGVCQFMTTRQFTFQAKPSGESKRRKAQHGLNIKGWRSNRRL